MNNLQYIIQNPASIPNNADTYNTSANANTNANANANINNTLIDGHSNINETITTVTNHITNQNEYILASLYKFYGSIQNLAPSNEINRILPILSGQSKLSIRVIDWFVTNFSKKKNIMYSLQLRNNTLTYFNVYLDYKSQLKGYKKKLFDPFCRKRRIPFYYTSDKCLITTIGQLIFFRWAIVNKVLDYVDEHFVEINKDMNETIKSKSTTNISNGFNGSNGSNGSNRSNGSNGSNASNRSNESNSLMDSQTDTTSTEKKRHELSINASKTINCHKMKIILDMN